MMTTRTCTGTRRSHFRAYEGLMRDGIDRARRSFFKSVSRGLVAVSSHVAVAVTECEPPALPAFVEAGGGFAEALEHVQEVILFRGCQ